MAPENHRSARSAANRAAATPPRSQLAHGLGLGRRRRRGRRLGPGQLGDPVENPAKLVDRVLVRAQVAVRERVLGLRVQALGQGDEGSSRRWAARHRRRHHRQLALGLGDHRLAEDLAERLVKRLGEGDPGLVGQDHALELGERGDRRAEVDRLHVEDRVAHGQDQQVAADDVRAGLAPQRELGADPRVLVDPRLDLLRSQGRGVGREAERRSARRTRPGSMRAAIQAIMFGRLAATSGWMRMNSLAVSPGIRMIT